MPTLNIDLETYSSIDIADAGVHKYTESPDFEILLFAYSVDGSPVEVVDLCSGGEVPQHIVALMHDPTVRLSAHNAAFERTAIRAYAAILGVHAATVCAPERWDCTMVRVGMMGYPMSLGKAAEAVGVTEQKLKSGTALINYFSKPCKPTKANGYRRRNLPHHSPDKWAQFIEYCRQDVVTEITLREALKYYRIPEFEQKLWQLDQRINDRGLLVNSTLVHNAIRIHDEYRDRLLTRMGEVTGLDNPNSLAQLKAWLSEETGKDITGLTKKDIPVLLKDLPTDSVGEVLRARQELGKTSVKKFEAMASGLCDDGRVRGLLQYYGAIRTGRWAGRRVQVQNLPQNKLHGRLLDLAREWTIQGNGEALELFFGNIPDVLSQLIRTAFEAPEGKVFGVSDFTSIEAVVLSWLAGEQWRLDVFKRKEDMYIASASKMFGVPAASIDKGSDLRQRGKVAELALGYQGGKNALITMGALDKGLTDAELQPIVDAWRAANPKIVQFWYNMNKAAIRCVKTGEKQYVRNDLYFMMYKGTLLMTLPSGRRLFYPQASIGRNQFDSDCVNFYGPNSTTGQWSKLSLYGGILVENAVQAMSRDLLAVAMQRLDAAGFPIVLHVHDEVVCEITADRMPELDAIMSQPVAWAPDLPLSAKGFITNYYLKD